MAERFEPAEFKARVDTVLDEFLAAEAERLRGIDHALEPVAEQLRTAAGHGNWSTPPRWCTTT
ncbi:hypothetical protein ACWELO_02105 [Streptomyces sp. NPDC004596]|uniref:hypothetical protein n=1 Tax=Streptomyces sp. DSM 118148 TaxID=3448667 RepID=UPI00403FDD26